MCDGFSDNYLYRILQASSTVLGETGHFPKNHCSALVGRPAMRTVVTRLVFLFSLPFLHERSIVESGHRTQGTGCLGHPLLTFRSPVDITKFI